MTPTPKSLRRTALILAVTLAPLVLVACGPVAAQADANASAAQEAESAQAGVRAVRTIQAQRGVLSTSRSTSVTVEPAQESMIAAGTSGQVASILKREGATLKKGETVVQLDDETLRLQAEDARIAVESARINLQKATTATQEGSGQVLTQSLSAETSFELAEQQYAEGQRLFEAGAISQFDLTGLQAQLEQARGSSQLAQNALASNQRADTEDLELLRLQLEQAQSQLAQAERALEDAAVTAPFAGEIAEMLVEQGEFIGAGSPVFNLVSSEEQLARFTVPVQDATRLLAQGTVWIGYNGLDYGAEIIRSSQLSDGSRLVELTAKLYHSNKRMPTGVTTQLDYELTLGQGIKLPAGAVQTSAGDSYVFTVTGDTTKRQAVTLTSEAGDETIVRGVQAGANVIYPVSSDLRDGLRVSVLAEGNQP